VSTGVQGPPAYDELRDPAGSVRAHWAYLADALEQLGHQELAERAGQARRLLHQDGATYTVQPSGAPPPTAAGSTSWGSASSAGPDATQRRPWELDPIPLVVPSDEWAEVERGLIQRAELLDMLLRDLYGDRSVIERGIVPPEVIFGHDGYLRAAHGIEYPPGAMLVFAAADLVRVADGSLVVVGDRTQAPSGAGYALENRRVMNRVFPSLFRDAHVHRLSGWFRTVRTALQRLVPRDGSEGRIVVLTPGSSSETYFEHAFLAAYLGYALVEAADLTVRHGRVWLRSLGGLEPVDVIVRRVDDTWCDPLELRSDSRLGVVGLVEAIRRGNVSVVNPIGAGVVENPGLLPFLGPLCRELLGQDLVLPSVTTWWCGDPTVRAEVLDRLPELVLKPISRSWGSLPVFGHDLDADEVALWRRVLAVEPWRWVAQERLALSEAPVLGTDRVEARPAVLRTHLVAHGDSYAVMPGGLTRVGANEGDPLVSNRTGASSKDTWVLASEPEAQITLWHTGTPVEGFGVDERALPSRTSENLLWMGRYAERAEATIRLTRVVLERLDDPEARSDPADRVRLGRLLVALTHLTDTYPGFAIDPDAAVDHPEPGLLALLTDGGRASTLDGSLRSLLAAAYGVRDRLSGDTWQVVSDVEDDLAALRRLGTNLLAVRSVTDRLLRALLALSGLAQESMVRDAGWRFLDTGRRLERALVLTSLARSLLVPPIDEDGESLVLESFLASAESLVAYRRRYRSNLSAVGVLDLVLGEPSNPRSLCHQLERLGENLGGLPHTTPGVRDEAEDRLVLDATTSLRLADLGQLAVRNADTGRRDELEALMVRIAGLLAQTSHAVASRLFTHLQPDPRLVGGPMLLAPAGSFADSAADATSTGGAGT
jgi:uncharacterized circularly permuted ATP-grasp superfamily protein/uncharacterized alpha-E superfamily protein